MFINPSWGLSPSLAGCHRRILWPARVYSASLQKHHAPGNCIPKLMSLYPINCFCLGLMLMTYLYKQKLSCKNELTHELDKLDYGRRKEAAEVMDTIIKLCKYWKNEFKAK